MLPLATACHDDRVLRIGFGEIKAPLFLQGVCPSVERLLCVPGPMQGWLLPRSCEWILFGIAGDPQALRERASTAGNINHLIRTSS